MENLEFSSLAPSLFFENLNTDEGLQFLEFEGAKSAYDFIPAAAECQNLFILINGYQRTRLDFRAFRKKLFTLSPHTATLAFDNRYCGQTVVASNEPLTVERMARDALALAGFYCKVLNLNTFSVLGISMGGMIAQALASRNSSINKLFLVSTTAGGIGRSWPKEVKDPSKLEYKNNYETLESTKKHMARYFGDRFVKTSSLLFEMMCKTLVKANNDSNTVVDFGAKAQFFVSANYDGVVNLNNIKAKTLIVSGNEDQIIPVENARYLSNNIQNSSLIIYNEVGHLILIEEPEKFANDICQFLN